GATSGADPTIAVRLEPGASRAAVTDALDELGALPEPAVGGATTNNARFLGTLADMLRAVAAVNGLMCLYALVQALALTALERRPAMAVLRAGGAGRRHLALVFGGAAALVVVLAGVLGLALERLLLGPAVTALAADYAALPLSAGAGSMVAVIAGLVVVAVVSSAWVGRRVAREPVVAGLRAE
ncbi:MAG: FtsX-like permease family protein, partial [Thermoleophilaceae bacterium]